MSLIKDQITKKGDEYYDPHKNDDESDQEDNKTATLAHSKTDAVIEIKSQDTKSDLKRMRETHQWIRRTANNNLKNGNSDKLEEGNNFSLKVSNLPTNWSFEVIKDVIFEHYGPVNYIHMAADNDKCFVGTVKLEFVNFSDCQKAWENLHGRNVDGIKLFAEMRDIDEESDDESTPAKMKRLNKSWRPDVDIWDADPKGLYGLKPEFLESLEIKPPIDRWVHVTNFRCDKSELKEVMELAGQVLICTVNNNAQKLGKVMYSHPLEAVQAVSMLNRQLFYGQSLSVTIGSCPTTFHFLPKGLPEVGPGLGEQGKPLRDVVKQYERFVQFKGSYVNPNIFRDPEEIFLPKADDSEIYIPKKIRALCNDSIDLKQYKLEQNRNKSLSPALRNNSPYIRDKIEGPMNDPEQIHSLSSMRSIGQMAGSISISNAQRPMGVSAPNNGSTSGQTGQFSPGWTIGVGLMSNQGSMAGPIGIQRPMGVPAPMGNQGPIGRLGPIGMVGLVGPQRPLGVPGPMVGPGPMNNMGPMGGPGPMNNQGPMNSIGPMPVPGPMNHIGHIAGSAMNNMGSMAVTGSMANLRPINGPNVEGPMMGNQRAITGPLPMGTTGSMMGYQGPMSGWPMGNQGTIPGWPMGNQGAGPGPMMPGSMGGPGPMGSVTPKATIELSNLPLSTSFPLLCEKMAECGNVMSVQLTTPGCALVQFAQAAQAEACVRQYNKRCILGNVIEVKYL